MVGRASCVPYVGYVLLGCTSHLLAEVCMNMTFFVALTDGKVRGRKAISMHGWNHEGIGEEEVVL